MHQINSEHPYTLNLILDKIFFCQTPFQVLGLGVDFVLSLSQEQEQQEQQEQEQEPHQNLKEGKVLEV